MKFILSLIAMSMVFIIFSASTAVPVQTSFECGTYELLGKIEFIKGAPHFIVFPDTYDGSKPDNQHVFTAEPGKEISKAALAYYSNLNVNAVVDVTGSNSLAVVGIKGLADVEEIYRPASAIKKIKTHKCR